MMFACFPTGVVPRVGRLFLVAQLAWLVGCQHGTTPARGDGNAQSSAASLRENGYGPGIEEFPVLRNRLKKLAGDAAIDCGSVGLMQEPGTASACVLRTHADGKPFYVSYAWQGIDSHGAIGFAADASGNVFELDYDSEGWTSEGLPKNLQLSDLNHITTERCSKPVNLRKAGNGRVTCFLRDL
jgi:hypothetical protein